MPATVIQSEPLQICCHVIVTQWRPKVEQSARDFRNPPLQAKEGICVNRKLITAWHYNCEPDSCAVCFIPVNKLPLQESNQSITIKRPTSGFSRIIWFLIPISRAANASFAPLRMPMRSLTILYQVPQTRPAHLMKRKNVFD